MTKKGISKDAMALALRAKFSDFERQESPERGWWIFERNACSIGEAKERLLVTIAGGSGRVRLSPKVGLRFESLAVLDAAIWNDPKRIEWHMSAGLERSLSEFMVPPSIIWEVEYVDRIDSLLNEIKSVYEEKARPIFSRLCTVFDVCLWFDEFPLEARNFAPDLTFAVFNLAAKRNWRALEIAERCLAQSESLPKGGNEATMKVRDRYNQACVNIIERARSSGK